MQRIETFLSKLTRRKTYQPKQYQGLARRLSAFDLVLYGIGSIIGAGIFVLTGMTSSYYIIITSSLLRHHYYVITTNNE